MFDLGFWELLFVGVIALVVLGPERLPVAARTLGRWVGRARAYTRSLSNELDREVQIRELRANMRSAESKFRSEVSGVDRSVRELAEDTAREEAKKPPSDAGAAEASPADSERTLTPSESDVSPAPELPPEADSDDGSRW
ncbi:Sec-independent protein translocase protein TatB [Algiphilus aromaticivorans]|uniref:Sec-independent protein translocase protein TatB n=1 Tax=Algiphilus aromaticivorans TaxID=382454 RepID=UPI0005C1ECE0|nr:Sec-independent protein translocase protein TatB [Algiphilus aromaticivorans]